MERGDIVFLVRSGCRFDFPYFCKGIKGPGYDIFDWRNSADCSGKRYLSDYELRSSK